MDQYNALHKLGKGKYGRTFYEGPGGLEFRIQRRALIERAGFQRRQGSLSEVRFVEGGSAPRGRFEKGPES